MLHKEQEDINPAVQVWHVRWHRGQNKRAPSSYQPALHGQEFDEITIALLFTVSVIQVKHPVLVVSEHV